MPPSFEPARPESTAAAGDTPSPALCVYYDGGCPLCRAEIATYQRTEGGDAVMWVDAHGCPPAALGPGLQRPDALARLHVRRADGTLLHGAAAFAEIWATLPRWRWLARLVRLPGVLPVLELGYRGFLRVRPLWRPAGGTASALPLPLLRELRTDHAGETGAVMIYRGILAVTRDPELRAFAQHHLATEARHLELIEPVVPPAWRSRLLPLWRVSGWLTGALPACFGPRAVYATIQAVETFVDRHYAAQLDLIDTLPPTRELTELRTLLQQCQQDEVAHRDDAAARWNGRARGPLAVWRWLVGSGSAAAVRVCRHI